ncbi:MAG: ATP-dependent Clp protease proteolytic subunit [Comamonadaceae bacterium]|jgi:ATP-dependent Clp protease protease subunit|uniref:ATP-dependent Clp protease proteolytic subunit n=1 Tax=Hydrogenophaga sp. SNF1 TaxID=3098762 RepID=UPI002ACBFA7B|nr:ATP-dependent Clp protease proteolytic subunit [Hydrogenophaga sp. SNF1]NCT95762.1 ATP-dependent Clp protease proteolytic subunit [Comamonadaceae bacterium]WQB82061.1 ATP-dependent Clp protease proteolytic subunit [Hydrogenophaga sp. SNF1]
MLSPDTDTPTRPANAQDSAFLEEKAFRARTVLVFGTITDALAAETVRKLLALDAEARAPITLVVSSPGGHLESGDAIHDVVRFVASPVHMVGTGWVGSAATHLYLGAARERRVCLPQTRFLIHQPSGGAGGAASDMAIQAQEILKARERIAEVIARETGQPLERVRQDIERDRWMPAQEAVAYGLASRVIRRREELGL